jgi:hypothetical protein
MTDSKYETAPSPEAETQLTDIPPIDIYDDSIEWKEGLVSVKDLVGWDKEWTEIAAKARERRRRNE